MGKAGSPSIGERVKRACGISKSSSSSASTREGSLTISSCRDVECKGQDEEPKEPLLGKEDPKPVLVVEKQEHTVIVKDGRDREAQLAATSDGHDIEKEDLAKIRLQAIDPNLDIDKRESQKIGLKDGDDTEVEHIDGGAPPHRRMQFLSLFLLAYLIIGCIFYWVAEGWTPLESLVVICAIMTGVGYGHIAPTHDLGFLFTALYMCIGLMIFGVIVGKLLDMIVGTEITAMSDAVKAAMATETEVEAKDRHALYVKERFKKKQSNFIVGAAHVSFLVLITALGVRFFSSAKASFAEAVYLAMVIVLKLDSLCAMTWVHCASGNEMTLVLTIVWYIITYTAVAHFLFSTSEFFGFDPDSMLTKVKHLNKDSLCKMDSDGDGSVSRSEFLRAQLISNNLVEADIVDMILANFDSLDKDHTGFLDQRDLSCKASVELPQ